MVRLILSLSILLFSGCGIKESKNLKFDNSELVKNEFIPVDSLGIPIYNFEELEPLLKKIDDKIYIFNFWATWCAPCVKELPHFEKINQEGKNDNLEVILVSLDMPSMWKSKLLPFIKTKNLQSKVVVLNDPDQNSWIPKIDKNWSGAIPATLIYNRKKSKFYEQAFTYEMLNKEIQEFK